jgi:hypothetical protein
VQFVQQKSELMDPTSFCPGTWAGFKKDYPQAKVEAAFAFHRKT